MFSTPFFVPFDEALFAYVLQGPRMVRDVFRLAKENAPAIIFIDEVDAIATARFDAQTGADRCALFNLLETAYCTALCTLQITPKSAPLL